MEPFIHRPSFTSNNFKKLSEEQRNALEGSLTPQEIKTAVWSCAGDKAQGPDGISFEFLKKFWSTVESDIVNAVQWFGESASFEPCSNSSFISLIPKVRDPLYVTDYRPISLVGALYKIIAKLLSSRLKQVMNSVIGNEQTAFIKGRSILDGPMIINELVSWSKRTKRQMFLLKVDIEKAFDTISWNFLDAVLAQMNFGTKWRNWIKGCLSSSRVSALINGSPTLEFQMFRGVRQGDPLAPFLFIIGMEALNVALKEAIHAGIFEGIQLPNGGPMISNLFYADDAIFVGNWSKRNALNLMRILRCFYIASGLKINLSKTSLFGIGVHQQEVIEMANVLNCSSGDLPFNFLGLPVGKSMNRKASWQSMVDKFQSRLSRWKAATLSSAGRVMLCKSVLGSLGIYLFSLFKVPDAILSQLEGIRSTFFWGGG